MIQIESPEERLVSGAAVSTISSWYGSEINFGFGGKNVDLARKFDLKSIATDNDIGWFDSLQLYEVFLSENSYKLQPIISTQKWSYSRWAQTTEMRSKTSERAFILGD